MAIDKFGNWDGICACGKEELDGIKCRLGATHLNGFSDGLKLGRGRDRVQEQKRGDDLPLFRERLPVRRERL